MFSNSEGIRARLVPKFRIDESHASEIIDTFLPNLTVRHTPINMSIFLDSYSNEHEKNSFVEKYNVNWFLAAQHRNYCCSPLAQIKRIWIEHAMLNIFLKFTKSKGQINSINIFQILNIKVTQLVQIKLHFYSNIAPWFHYAVMWTRNDLAQSSYRRRRIQGLDYIYT